MKGRESGMPEREMWKRFFCPEKIIQRLGLTENIKDVAEFGCGYGTFTLPAARVIQGKVYAIDMDPEMIKMTAEEAEKTGIKNIETIPRDFISEGTGLKDESSDYAMLFNILHVESPEKLLREAWRILRPGGKLGIIHWNYDPTTPRGPSMEIRPKPEDCLKWAENAGFIGGVRCDLKPYHYGMVLIKREVVR